jgi:L-iditol 2-dehydrogenase
MRAAVLVRRGAFEVREIPDPVPERGGLVLRVLAVGLCGSDERLVRQGSPRVRLPAVIGHEVSGEVVAVGKRVAGWRVGDRVAVGSGAPCGRCRWCRAEAESLCAMDRMIGYQIPGGLAEYMAVPAEVVRRGSVVRVPSEMSDDEAAMAEPLGCVLHAFERVQWRPGCSLAILGAGSIGHMMARLARRLGASRVLLIGRSPRQVRQAARAGYDVVMVACGGRGAGERAAAVAAKRGRIHLFGVSPRRQRSAVPSREIHYKELTVTGSHGCGNRHHRRAVALLASGRLALRTLVSHTFPLEGVREAFATMERRPHLKIMIHPQGA